VIIPAGPKMSNAKNYIHYIHESLLSSLGWLAPADGLGRKALPGKVVAGQDWKIQNFENVKCMKPVLFWIFTILTMQQNIDTSEAGSISFDSHEKNPALRFDQRKGALLDALSCGVDKSKKKRFFN
jgi:hypothetical protein